MRIGGLPAATRTRVSETRPYGRLSEHDQFSDFRQPPLTMGRSSSSTWVKGVAEMFASQGVDVPRLFRAAGADMALLDAPDARFPADQVTRLWELAVTWSGNPALGLDRELALRHVSFDVVGYAMLSSPDLHAGLDSLSRYLALISAPATFALQPAPVGAWLVLGHTG